MILGIHQGAGGTTCLVLDEDGELAGRASRGIAAHAPEPGWVEHDPRELWEATCAAAVDALEDAGAGHVHAIGIAGGRDTVCVWDPQSGEPLHAALAADDRRAAGLCDRLHGQGAEALVRERAGLALDPSLGAAKIAWLLEHVDGLAERARQGRAVFGTAAAWLVHALTGEQGIDVASASRTLLYDIRRGAWDPELLDLFGVPERALPPVRPAIGEVGRTRGDALPGWDGVPVTGVAADEQAALYGQACLDPGQGRASYGAGASLVQLNAGDRPVATPEGVLATVAWSIGQRAFFALEAPVAGTGGDGGTGTTGPASAGPATDTGATSAEAVAFEIADVVAAMEAVAPEPLRELRADGPGTGDDRLMQLQADVLGVPVAVPEVGQTAATGAAFLAGVGCGGWTQGEVRRLWREGRRYEPSMSEDERAERRAEWERAREQEG